MADTDPTGVPVNDPNHVSKTAQSNLMRIASGRDYRPAAPAARPATGPVAAPQAAGVAPARPMQPQTGLIDRRGGGQPPGSPLYPAKGQGMQDIQTRANQLESSGNNPMQPSQWK